MKYLKFIRNVELDPEEILMVESDVNYSNIWLLNGKKVIIAKTLKQISEIVKDAPFVRVNRKTVLNINHIEKYTGSDEAQLSNGLKISFSRRRASLAHIQINQYLSSQF
ncbi:MAG: LytTR family transcriptional regulator [Bacteroidetes bacterium]|nr:LytTR family transcriptional regulator [Bacteroidota bacterium]